MACKQMFGLLLAFGAVPVGFAVMHVVGGGLLSFGLPFLGCFLAAFILACP